MRYFLFFLHCIVFLFSGVEEREQFFEKHQKHYQDICIEGKIFKVGYTICDKRYDLIRPILESYSGEFSLLDLGACEGYFSFRIAQEYPAFCYMIEGGIYKDKPEKLLELCKLNKGLNVFLMQYRIDLEALKDLAEHDHFDVVLALLVIHQMAEQKHDFYESRLEAAKKYIEVILELGNHVVIEMPTDICQELDSYVSKLCKERNGKYLGSLPRIENVSEKVGGRFYLFTSEQPVFSPTSISDRSFKKLNGVFKPLSY